MIRPGRALKFIALFNILIIQSSKDLTSAKFHCTNSVWSFLLSSHAIYFIQLIAEYNLFIASLSWFALDIMGKEGETNINWYLIDKMDGLLLRSAGLLRSRCIQLHFQSSGERNRCIHYAQCVHIIIASYHSQRQRQIQSQCKHLKWLAVIWVSKESIHI